MKNEIIEKFKVIILSIFFLSLLVNCDLIGLCKEAAYDNDYKIHERAVDEGNGYESDLFDIALAGGYSTDTIKQLLNDGYLTDYLDLLKELGLVQDDFIPVLGEQIIDPELIKKDKTDLVYKENQDELRIFKDEQDNTLIIQSTQNVVAIKFSDALVSQRAIANVKDYPMSIDKDGVRTWIIYDYRKYLSLLDNSGRDYYYVSAAVSEENGGYWLSGYLFGDAQYVEAGTITY